VQIDVSHGISRENREFCYFATVCLRETFLGFLRSGGFRRRRGIHVIVRGVWEFFESRWGRRSCLPPRACVARNSSNVFGVNDSRDMLYTNPPRGDCEARHSIEASRAGRPVGTSNPGHRQSQPSAGEWIQFFLTAVETQARRNADKARDIKALYEKLKGQVIELTRSQFAVPLLDVLFQNPILPSTHVRLPGRGQPSRQAISGLLRSLREAGILKVLREGSGRRPQVLALAELLELAEGKSAI
jgi:hypothetical protein